MDNVTFSASVALKEEVARTLESLGEHPKRDQFEHGMQVGIYIGLKRAIEVLDQVLRDDTVRQDNL